MCFVHLNGMFDDTSIREAVEEYSIPGQPIGADVLLVEDNPVLRGLVRSALQEGGYTVHAVDNPHVAEALLRAGSYGLVATDIDLGSQNPNGHDLVNRARELNPGYVALRMSGADTDVIDACGADNSTVVGQNAYLRKPFQLSEFTSLVSRLTPCSQ